MKSFSSALGAYIGGFVGWEDSAATAHKTFETKYFSREMGVFLDDFRKIGWQLEVDAVNSDGPGKILP